ncbi:hypothetical protein [Motilimonas eburnea]|uniref:hypothetical protein n=1 Tax=Motilimonas eburnea TaxID=1737488 RepID=UPI001E4A699F|nr:hypothetical protein [Motilimonas eburnea]MCE2572156.1 hypothetical protein [Motilimonas eburnea]
MKYRSLLTMLSLPVLWSCAQSPQPAPQAPITTESATLTRVPFSQVLETNFRGQLALGDNEAWFTPCGFEEAFPLTYGDDLKMIYNKISPRSFEPTYVEFAGEIVPSANQTDASIRVDRVHHMALSKTSPQCTKAVTGFHFKAKGDNPFWNTLVAGQNLTFTTQSSSQKYDINLSKFETTQRNNIRAVGKNGFVLQLRLNPGHCYSDNGRVYWGYQAEADAAWGKYQGCAEPAWPDVDTSIIGNYMGNKLHYGQTVMDLALNEDYSATLVTQTQQGKKTESGFWKSNNPTEVSLFLTQSAGKPIAKEIIFSREGLALTASESNNAGIVTQYQGGVFQLDKMSGGQILASAPQAQPKQRRFSPANINPTGLDRQIQQAVAEYFRYHRTSPANTKFSAVKYDLNGDGIDDAIVQLNWCSKHGCVMLVFEGTGKGYQFLSRTEHVAAPILVGQSQQYHWQTLYSQVAGDWRSLYYNGVSYPGNSKHLSSTSPDRSTGVVLFANGKPRTWYAIR